MKRLERAAIICRLASELRSRGSWCGETHIQKSSYFLQELNGVPTEFEFFLYKHGPFSFDLSKALTEMRADGLMILVAQPYPYGPTMEPSEQGTNLEKRFSKTVSKYEKKIKFVAESLRSKNVADLERLSTGLMVTKEMGTTASVDDRTNEVCNLKPHVSKEAAMVALEEVDQMISRAQGVS